MTCREEEKKYVVESDCKPEMKSDNYYHNVVIQPPKGMGVAGEERVCDITTVKRTTCGGSITNLEIDFTERIGLYLMTKLSFSRMI